LIRIVILTALLSSTLSFAQRPNSVAATAPHLHAFEVVSIRPNNSGNRGVSLQTTPDGYRATGQSISQTILIAYFPQGTAYWPNRLQGVMPSWTYDPYNIDARVDEADLPQWQKQGVILDKEPMLREMLQSMLADRCKLAFHRIPGEITGFALVVKSGKHGARLPASKPGATLPAGVKFPEGGVAVGNGRNEPGRWAFYNATAGDLVHILSGMSMAGPVVDRTSLTGHYDFVLHCGELDTERPERSCGVITPDLLSQWDLDSLGLRLVPIKIPIDTLVIDHIEKPSEN
jgi:bla regulator protein BlaR1